MNDRFRTQQRAAKLSQLLPSWAGLAACAENAPNQAPWEPMFLDDVAQRPDPDSYQWPAGTLTAMKTCAGCPVRRQCLDYCFASELREATEWWQHELVPQNRRFGVYGGVPGRIREAYSEPEQCDAWFKRWAATQRIDLDDTDTMSA